MMKSTFAAVLVLLFCSCAGTADKIKTETIPEKSADGNLFSLNIYQHGQQVKQTGRVFHLSKGPFQLEFIIPETRTLYANFNTSGSSYEKVLQGIDVSDVIGFGGNGFAEYEGNPDREILISNDSWHVWPVDDSRFLRFDISEHMDGAVRGLRTVENLKDVDRGIYIDFKTLDFIFIVLCDVQYYGKAEWRAERTAVFELRFN